MEIEGSQSWGFVARIGRILADLGDVNNARTYLGRAAELPGGHEAKVWLTQLSCQSAGLHGSNPGRSGLRVQS